ncbi:RICIN domain-containing protein [Pedobacter psychrodurus]|uniref:RICIN domain-containing protein n=1 Tax=Pedobacter psychrodurus TaxID=2530456 RepID=UPI0029318442|nr:glycosyl hydrolase family 18 protein [Pedobacter psychrodurus]
MKNQKKMSFKVLAFVLLAIVIVSCKKNANLEEFNDQASTFKQKGAKSFVGHPVGLQTNLRMYGYMETWGTSYAQYLDSINLTQLTDLCISFVNPDVNGNFNVRQDIIDAVPKAHLQGVRVHYSIGGGGGPAYWDNLITPANRTQVIKNMMDVLNNYNFDGIDVDLEGARISNNPANYNAFLIQLADSIHSYSKLVSIAIARYQANQVTTAAYAKLDYLNAMIYDYQSGVAGPHSSFAQFQYDFGIFSSKLPAAKINLGVPGYAYQYEGNTVITQVSIKSILSQYPKAYALNYQYANATKSWWYDGHPVLRQKVAYCLQQGVGGMMIWQMMHDPKDDESSLLKLMNFCAGSPAMAGFNPLVDYSFTAKNSNLPMEVAGASLNSGAGVQQNTWTNANNQKWFLAATNNEFKITNKNSGKVLDEVDETASGQGVQFIQNTWHGGGNQRYRLVPNALGYYKVVNVASNRLASVFGASTTPGTKIVQWPDGNGDNQQFIIKRH